MEHMRVLGEEKKKKKTGKKMEKHIVYCIET